MPVNRTKRSRKSLAVEDWKKEFLQYGRVLRKDGAISSMPYLWLPEHNGCFAGDWRATWDDLKDELLRQWAREGHAGLPWALRMELED